MLYDGTPNLDIIEGWIQEIKKKISALNIPACFRASLVAYKLIGKADYWWDSVGRGRNVKIVTWEEFEEMFY